MNFIYSNHGFQISAWTNNFNFLIQICHKKDTTLVQTKTKNTTTGFFIFELDYIKFQLKLTIFIFWTKLVQKEYFEKYAVNITIEFCIFELFSVANFTLNKHFWILDQICPEKVFRIKTKRIEHLRWILHIRISLSTKFQLNRQFSIFGPNLPKMGIYSL